MSIQVLLWNPVCISDRIPGGAWVLLASISQILFACLYRCIFLYFCLSVVSVSPSLCLCVSKTLCMWLCASLSLSLCLYFCLYMIFCLSCCLSLSLHISACFSISASCFSSIYVSLSLSLSLSIRLCLSICLIVSVSLPSCVAVFLSSVLDCMSVVHVQNMFFSTAFGSAC